MTTYVVGCDNIDGNEQNYIDRVSTVLEEAGHTVEKRPVGPGYVQNYGKTSASSGKTAVFIVGGSDGGTYQDFVYGIGKQGYYHYDLCWFAFASWTANSWITEEGLKNTPLVRAHDDNFSTSTTGFVGKTAAQYFSENSQYIKMAYGDTPEEVAKMILNGGEDSDNDDGGSASTIKEAIKEVLSYWDAEAQCVVEGDTMYIHRIYDPEEPIIIQKADGSTYEEYPPILQTKDNIYQDTISITDYNPDTVNVLTVHSEVMEDIVYRNEKLIERFGEKPLELDAVKLVTVTTTEEVPVEDTTTTDDTTTTETTTDTISTDTTTTDDTTTTETTTETTTKTEEVPCETPEEVESFARREWAKIKRDDGHTIELTTHGWPKWKVGKWVHLYIPEFDEYDPMYITKVSQSDDGESKCQLTLAEYPPGFGELKEETTADEDTEEENTDETTDETTTTEETTT